MNSPLDTLTKRFTPCVIICPCDKWLSQQRKLLEVILSFKKKLNKHSNYVKFKAYIVAKDFSQVPSKYFSETFSSVTKFTIIWVFFALAAYLDFNIHQVDIITAYL